MAQRVDFALVGCSFTNALFTWVPDSLRPFDPSATREPEVERLHALAPAVKAKMQADGFAMVGFQPWRGLNVFRLLFMNPEVTSDHVDTIIDYIA